MYGIRGSAAANYLFVNIQDWGEVSQTGKGLPGVRSLPYEFVKYKPIKKILTPPTAAPPGQATPDIDDANKKQEPAVFPANETEEQLPGEQLIADAWSSPQVVKMANYVLSYLLARQYSASGGMMTTEPIVLTADSTVAEALSRVRLSEVAPGLASQVFVCRQPIETPTGRLIGVVHIQRLLREPPATLLGGIVDSDIAGLR